MKNAQKILLFCLLAALISSCATYQIPQPRNEKQAFMVILVDFNDLANVGAIADYRFYTKTVDHGYTFPTFFKLNVSKKYNTVTKYHSGAYEVSRYREIARTDGDIGGGLKLTDTLFSLEAGKITIFPYKVHVTLEKKRAQTVDPVPKQSIEFEDLSERDYQNILEELESFGVDPALVAIPD